MGSAVFGHVDASVRMTVANRSELGFPAWRTAGSWQSKSSRPTGTGLATSGTSSGSPKRSETGSGWGWYSPPAPTSATSEATRATESGPRRSASSGTSPDHSCSQHTDAHQATSTSLAAKWPPFTRLMAISPRTRGTRSRVGWRFLDYALGAGVVAVGAGVDLHGEGDLLAGCVEVLGDLV